jgi:hypothetical protein
MGGTFSHLLIMSNFSFGLKLSEEHRRPAWGQAGNLIAENDALTAAPQIHSVEQRHASRVKED